MKGSVFKRCSSCGRRVDGRVCGKCQSKSFSWAYRAYVGKDDTGRWKERFLSGFETKRDADRALTELMTSINTGRFIAPSTTTLSDYLLLVWLPATKPPRVAHQTWADRKRNLEQHVVPHIGQVRLQALSTAHLNRLYDTLLSTGRMDDDGGLSPTSVRRIHAMLRKALGDAQRWGEIEHNPVPAADPPTLRIAQAARRRAMTTWTPAELSTFLTMTAGHRLHPAWFFAATTGVRRSELLGLRWSDLDIAAGTAGILQTVVDSPDGYVPVVGQKSATSARTLHLDQRTIGMLHRHRATVDGLRAHAEELWQEHDLVFPREDGRWHNPSSVSQSFDRAVARAGVPRIRLHDVRHTHATLLLAAGANAKVVSERLGHSSVAFTLDTYAHVMPGMQADIAERFVDLVFDDDELDRGVRRDGPDDGLQL